VICGFLVAPFFAPIAIQLVDGNALVAGACLCHCCLCCFAAAGTLVVLDESRMQEPAASGDAELCEQFNKAINTVMGESAAQVACM